MEMLFTTRAERYALCPWPKEPPYHATKIHLYIMDCIHNVLFIQNQESGVYRYPEMSGVLSYRLRGRRPLFGKNHSKHSKTNFFWNLSTIPFFKNYLSIAF